MTRRAGHRYGERHHRAKITDAEVELIRSLYEEGGWTYRSLAEKMDINFSTVRDIVKFRRRVGPAVRT